MGDATIQASGLMFVVEHRTFGGDGGPAIRVMGATDQGEEQLLRFDCFEKSPHYHYAPDDKNEMWNLDKVVVPDPVAWTLQQLREHLPAMIGAAGYTDLAEKVDTAAVSEVLGQIEQEMRHP